MIVLGHILDDKGRKMSKRLGNIVDPWSVINVEGVDALRYYLYTASPPGQPRRFSAQLVRQSLRQFLLTLWNCYSFFVTYADLAHLFDRCIETPDIAFAVVHGVSNNRFLRLDLTDTRRLLNYEPKDDAFATSGDPVPPPSPW